MESLSEHPWDVIIAGTGLTQSLLALALSRSGKKVLHLDQNSYYGGSEAAFSLDEASEWMNSVNQRPGRTPFEDVNISTYQPTQDSSQHAPSEANTVPREHSQGTPGVRPELAASRSYTLSLSPYFLYNRSELISVLISSKVYRQLEFMAVGSWWIHTPVHVNTDSHETGAARLFHRVPGNREDVFADSNISMKSKRTLMRFLRHISKSQDEEERDETEEKDNLSMPLADYLSLNFSVPQDLHDPLLSLSLSQLCQQDTSAGYAVSRIKRHLTSVGALGPGFGAVVSKYGGGSEMLQVACRASAVGGAVYALDTGIQSVSDSEVPSESDHPVEVRLSNGETIRTRYVIGSTWDLPGLKHPPCTKVARSITIVSSAFMSLFPITAEGGPVPASAVLMFPGETLGSPQSPPVYLQVHSSDTDDCPRHQSIIYGSIAMSGPEGHAKLERAVDYLLQAEGPQAVALWSMRYTQLGHLSNGKTPATIQTHSPHIFSFPPSSLDLAFEDETVDMIKEAWVKIVGDEVVDNEFMIFEDREGASDD